MSKICENLKTIALAFMWLEIHVDFMHYARCRASCDR